MSMSSCDAGSSLPSAAPGTMPPVNCSESAPKPRTPITQERHMARKAFVADEATREKVRHLAGLGVRQDDIARMIGCAPKTLRKRCRNELDRGVAEANAMVSSSLFAAAKAGNTAAQIFWLKIRAGWREGGSAERTTRDATEPHPQAVLVLPDNNRDPELTEVLRDAQAKYFARKQRQQP